MPLIKSIIKALISPLRKLIRRPIPAVRSNGMWSGNYSNWQEAAKECDGYDAPQILEKCRAALLKVKNGTAVYERDSVLFDKKQYSWPLLALLQQIALVDNKLSVLDFGGSLGSTYYQNKSFLSTVKDFKWCIIEQKSFVECGKMEFEDGTLKFYYTIEECMKDQQPNVLILSGVLQCLEKPLVWLKKLTDLNIPHIIIDRTSFIQGAKDTPRATIQRVPAEIYRADYPCWFFTEDDFIAEFPNNYQLIADFGSYADPDKISDDGLNMYWKGFYFKRNS